MSDRGSISLEASLGMSLLLALMGLFFSIIYGSLIQGISYSEAAQAYIRLNHEIISESVIERNLSLSYSLINDGYILSTFRGLKEELPMSDSLYANAVDYITFVTDTGTKFHRPLCPTVKLSLRPIRYEEAIKYYSPCGVCRPGK
ncbi:MAG TPA: hypothetical protein GXZ74_07225 [Tissierellia bacterium]|nr:hypothetical protein [Tissierellia bacterium]